MIHAIRCVTCNSIRCSGRHRAPRSAYGPTQDVAGSAFRTRCISPNAAHCMHRSVLRAMLHSARNLLRNAQYAVLRVMNCVLQNTLSAIRCDARYALRGALCRIEHNVAHCAQHSVWRAAQLVQRISKIQLRTTKCIWHNALHSGNGPNLVLRHKCCKWYRHHCFVIFWEL